MFPEQQISVSESEWNRSVLEVDEEFDKVKDVQSATVLLLILNYILMNRNEKYEKEMDRIHALITTNKPAEAKNACENLLKGELKHRCENAEFWITYASIEKVYVWHILDM